MTLDTHSDIRSLSVGYGNAKALAMAHLDAEGYAPDNWPSELFCSSARRFPARPDRFILVSRVSDTEIFFHDRPISESINFLRTGLAFARFLLRASQPLPIELLLSNSVPDKLFSDEMFLLTCLVSKIWGNWIFRLAVLLHQTFTPRGSCRDMQLRRSIPILSAFFSVLSSCSRRDIASQLLPFSVQKVGP
jgi:hypothetical protein